MRWGKVYWEVCLVDKERIPMAIVSCVGEHFCASCSSVSLEASPNPPFARAIRLPPPAACPTQPHTAPHSPTQLHTAPHWQLSLLLTEPRALAHHLPQKSSAHPLIWFYYSCLAWVAEFWKVHSKCWHSTQTQDFVADFSGPPELWSCFSRVIISLVLRQQ